MIQRIGVLLTLAASIGWLGSAAPTPTFAAGYGGDAGPGARACPNPTTPGDGCSTQTPGALIQQPSLFTTAAQSGQVYKAKNTTWNQPFIDTPAGPYTARAHAVDPTLAGNHPSGCTVRAPTGNAADYQVIDCSAPPAFTWSKLEMGPINGHGPTMIHFHNNTANDQVFDDFWYTEPSSCLSSAHGVVIAVDNIATANFTFKNFYIDGSGIECAYKGGIGGISVATSGNITFQNGYFKNISTRPLNIIAGATSQVTINGNFFDGLVFNNSAHGEVWTITPKTGSIPGPVIKFNTLRVGPESCACLTTTFYLSNGVGGSLGDVDFEYNLIFTNRVGGANSRNGDLKYDLDDGTGLAGGNVLTVKALKGRATLAPGTFINGGGGASINLMDNISGGAGVGSKWHVSCQAPASSSCRGGSVRAGPVLVPTFKLSDISGSVQNETTGPACVQMAHNSYGAVTIANNRCDATGGTGYWNVLGKSTCGTATKFSNNKDMVSGASIDRFNPTAGGC